MPGLTITDRIKLGEFADMDDWVRRANRVIGGLDCICVDALGRECLTGKEFMRAEKEGTFPVSYWISEKRQKEREAQ